LIKWNYKIMSVKTLDELDLKFKEQLELQNEHWKSFIYAKSKGFYQGFKKIEIDGCRPTETRFKSYQIKKYFTKNMSVLDIGSNCGFFSIYASDYVKDIDGVEINPYLVSISNLTKEFLGNTNSFFYNQSFEDFKIEKKYDVIFSFGNDSTIDKNTKFNFHEYVQKILSLLKDNGLLIFECQAADMVPKTKFLPKLNYLEKHFKILENKLVKSEYPVNVPERFFLILKKSN